MLAIAEGDRAGRLSVAVDGRMCAVDAVWIDSTTLSLIADGVAHEIRILRGAAGSVSVEVKGAVFDADVAEAAFGRARARDAGGRKGPPGGRAIAAPMPGRVVRVLVKVGDRIPARQGVVIVEAMKMENVLRAPAEGTVTEIRVAAGSTVEAGAVLVMLD
jgi:biotin carboxyl carrier protein